MYKLIRNFVKCHVPGIRNASPEQLSSDVDEAEREGVEREHVDGVPVGLDALQRDDADRELHGEDGDLEGE